MKLKDNIVQQSLKLFSMKGFLNTSLQDIIEASSTSKGGFYNHFRTKEDLFLVALGEARKIWRQKNLCGLENIGSPFEKIIRFLENFRDLYLKNSVNFPGGCIFIKFAVELSDQRQNLAEQVQKGFIGLKGLIRRYLEEAKEAGEIRRDTNPELATIVLFNGILGATVIYGIDKSNKGLDDSMNALIQYVKALRTECDEAVKGKSKSLTKRTGSDD